MKLGAPILRLLAALGALLLPLAWLLTLGADPVGQTANYFRVLGAIFGAGAGWILLTVRGGRPTWKSCLVGGVAGSFAMTAISIAAPALGDYAASGWIVSGFVGGGMVALTSFAVRGGVPPRTPSGDGGGPAGDGDGGSKTSAER